MLRSHDFWFGAAFGGLVIAALFGTMFGGRGKK